MDAETDFKERNVFEGTEWILIYFFEIIAISLLSNNNQKLNNLHFHQTDHLHLFCVMCATQNNSGRRRENNTE